MEIIIALIGIPYFCFKLFHEWLQQDYKKKSEQDRKQRLKELDEYLSISEDDKEEVNRIITYYDRGGLSDVVNKNLDAILAVDPSISIRTLESYRDTLIRAKYGWYMEFSGFDLYGDRTTRAGKIEYAHQVEILLHEAGKNVEFVYVTRNDCDLYDDSVMYRGKIVLKEKHCLFFPDAKYRRLW